MALFLGSCLNCQRSTLVRPRCT